MNRTVSMRWLVAVVAGVVVGMFALTGTAAAPPAGAPVRIVDADNADQVAHVDADGNLQVGGTLGIDSTLPIATTSMDDPGRTAFLDQVEPTFHQGSEQAGAVMDIPEGKRLVITHVSGSARMPSGQDLIGAALIMQLDGADLPTIHHLVPIFTGIDQTGAPLFVFSQDMLSYVDGPDIDIALTRDTITGGGFARLAVSGYLIDCMVAPCS
jgi:hypothetical protein